MSEIAICTCIKCSFKTSSSHHSKKWGKGKQLTYLRRVRKHGETFKRKIEAVGRCKCLREERKYETF